MMKIKQVVRSTSALVPVLIFGAAFVAVPVAAQTVDSQVQGDAAAPPVVQAAPSPAATQAAAEPVAQGGGDIVITARKRGEDILKVPVAVTALTSEDLAVRGVVSLNDVANFTPGLNVNNNAAGRNDRSFQQLIIRGFLPSAATNPTASLFIDGVPVGSPSAFSSISDPERVEVLKGPQSAYFGRNTFAGAINVVNKLPGDVLAGSVGGMIGTRNNYKLHADIEGPIFGDKLTFRIGGDRFSKDGSYKNSFNTNQTLGDQQTTSGTVLLVAKPVSSLTIKAFGLLSEDKDGPSAQGLISANQITNSAGTVIAANQSNCILNGQTAAGVARTNRFICGTAPKLITGPSANTTNDAFIKAFLANPTGRLISPKDGVQGYGLKRRYYHLHLAADWEVGDTGITLSSLTGYNNERYSQLTDLDNVGDASTPNLTSAANLALGARTYFDYPYYVERVNHDFSQELRAAFDNSGPFRLTVGGSYLNSFSQAGLGGGNGAIGVAGQTATSGAYSVPAGGTRSQTLGAFFGASYDITDKFKLNLEGRYQIDKLRAYAQPGGYTSTGAFIPTGFYAGGEQLIEQTYKNFLPRVIAQYQFEPNTMMYVSFSKGINPGLFNTSFLATTPKLQALAATSGITIDVAPEKVTNYEIGLKGKFFDNALRISVDAYHAPWTNQINAITVNVLDANNTLQIIRGSANTGKVIMSGLEMDGTLTPIRHVDINFGGAITESNIRSFSNTTVTQLTGVTNFRGKENPNTSKYSTTVGAQYSGDLSADASWFVRSDYVFKSGMWSDAANIVKTPDMHIVNGRIGVSKGGVSIEAFVTNLFDTEAYTTISDASVLAGNFAYSAYSSGLIVGLPDKRTVGVQMKYKF